MTRNDKATNKKGTTRTSDDDASASSYYSCDVSDDNHQVTTDTTLYRILHNAKMDCFTDLDDEEYCGRICNGLRQTSTCPLGLV
jgi:hypothetical protein